MREGALLYLEELNRIPEETLNVLITAMAERELVIPRLGRILAEPGFVLVAAMNPFDAVGTARVSQAIADRMCRVMIGYLDADAEREIVRRESGAPTSGLPSLPSPSRAGHARTPRSAAGRPCVARSTWCAWRAGSRGCVAKMRSGATACSMPRSRRCPVASRSTRIRTAAPRR